MKVNLHKRSGKFFKKINQGSVGELITAEYVSSFLFLFLVPVSQVTFLTCSVYLWSEHFIQQGLLYELQYFA